MSTRFLSPEIEADYRHGDGRHEFVVGEDRIRGLSYASWEELTEAVYEEVVNIALDEVAHQDVPEHRHSINKIVLPELATMAFPSYALEDIRLMDSQVPDRLEEVQKISEMTDVPIVIGTPLDSPAGLRNSVLAFQRGQTTGYQYKSYSAMPREQEAFAFDEDAARLSIGTNTGVLISSEMIAASGYANNVQRNGNQLSLNRLQRLVSPALSSLVVVSYWAISRESRRNMKQAEYQAVLEECVTSIMKTCCNVKELVIVDASGLSAHYTYAAKQAA